MGDQDQDAAAVVDETEGVEPEFLAAFAEAERTREVEYPHDDAPAEEEPSSSSTASTCSTVQAASASMPARERVNAVR